MKLDAALKDAPAMEITNDALWQECKDNNKDPYGARVVKYAEDWARLMQVRLANGETIQDCAEETSRIADDDGITGFMYGAAVSILAGVWKHGDELRRWHNLEHANRQ